MMAGTELKCALLTDDCIHQDGLSYKAAHTNEHCPWVTLVDLLSDHKSTSNLSVSRLPGIESDNLDTSSWLLFSDSA